MPNQVGRPRAIDETVIVQLSEYLRESCSVAIACRKSGISTTTYYDEVARNTEFADRMRASRDVMDMMAMKHVYNSLRFGSLDTAKWWVARQDKRKADALRAKDYRLRKKVTVTKSQKQVRGSRTTLEPATQQPVSVEEFEASQQTLSLKSE